MYPMLGTRPDLTYAVAALGCHAANPGLDHQCTLKCVFRYLKATSSQQLIFGCGAPDGLFFLEFVFIVLNCVAIRHVSTATTVETSTNNY